MSDSDEDQKLFANSTNPTETTGVTTEAVIRRHR